MQSIESIRVPELWELSPAVFTPLSRQLTRLMHSESDSAEEFHSASYLAEVLLKCETTIALAILNSFDADEYAELGYQVVTSDGLGTWVDVLPRILSALTAAARTDVLPYTRSYTQKIAVQSPEYRFVDRAREIWNELSDQEFISPKNRLGLMQFLVALRNRTRGHGATTGSQYEVINPALIDLVSWLIDTSPFVKEDFLRPLKLKAGGHYSCRILRGQPTQEHELISSSLIDDPTAIYFRSANGLAPLPDFIFYVREDDSCFLLNSKRRTNGQSEFLDYLTNATRLVTLKSFLDKPNPKPASITAGAEVLDVTSSPAHNLPRADFTTYVPRVRLEEELREYLFGRVMNFVSLRGAGGVGKTTLALRVARSVINETDAAGAEGAAFDFILWFSARDVDLDDKAGPLLRRRQVTSVESCARLFSTLLSDWYTREPVESDRDFFARVLTAGRDKFLLILDNFESFDDVSELQQFIKKNLAFPSKALITSRENAFQGDQPIEVGGLTRAESADLIRRTSRQALCEPRIDEAAIARIYDVTLGNPYAIKLLINEFARSPNLDAVIQRAIGEDYLAALFRRSFERLEDGPAYLFLLIALSRVARTETFCHLACIGRRIDYNNAKQSILDGHLLDAPDRLSADALAYRVSYAATEFAKRIIIGHRMQREVEQDLELLQILSGCSSYASDLVAIYRELCASAETEADYRRRERNLLIANWIRENDAAAALEAAMALDLDRIDEDEGRAVLKNAAELNPASPDLWLRWARFEKMHGDIQRAADLTLRAVDFVDTEQALFVAGRELLAIMSTEDFKSRVGVSRRSTFTAGLISRLERIRPELASQTLSLLGWLYLQSGDRAHAREAAEEGLKKDPNAEPSRELLDRLRTRW